MLQWFDTFMGLVVVLLGVSLIVMILTQMVGAIINLRGGSLLSGVERLIRLPDESVSAHAREIGKGALRHELISDTILPVGSFRRLAHTIRPRELVSILDELADPEGEEWQKALHGRLDTIKSRIDQWFDSAMDRASQRFANLTRLVTVVLSLAVAWTLHLDAIDLFEHISSKPELRASLVASADAIMEQTTALTDDSSPIPGAYRDALLELGSRSGVPEGLRMPPAVDSREEAVAWIRESVSDTEAADSLVQAYESLLDQALTRSIDQLRDRATSIRAQLEEAGFELVPDPYPGLGYDLMSRHFLGMLLMAGLLSLGAPFWFNILKSMTSLRPILAFKDDREREARSGGGGE